MRCLAFIVSLLVFAMFPAVADSSLDPWPQTQSEYLFRWNGMPFGALSLAMEADDSRYTLRCHIESRGLLRLFSRHESNSDVSGNVRRLSGGPRRYETFYKSRGKPRHVRLVYDEEGQITEEVVEPPENPEKRPPVARELSRGTLDPLSYALAVRAALRDARAKGAGSFSLRIYEGRRLMDTEYRITGSGAVEQHGRNQPTIELTARRTPIAGFTAKELARMKNEPPLRLYFSDDDRLLLLRLELRLYGIITVDLT